MAVKKSTKKKEESAVPTKAEAKETAPKQATKPKAAAPKPPAAEPAPVAAATPTPPEPVAKAANPKGAAPKKAVAAPIKLSASQEELLKKIGETGEGGYTVVKKVEERSIESLLTKKLIKKGAKDKGTGKLRYHVSAAGKKHTS